jgi:cyclopropane fatty-acyl-phospholipid synthase-like methyltransferase
MLEARRLTTQNMVADLISIAFTLVAIVINVLIVFTILIPMILGAPFVPIDKTVLKKMIALLQVQPGEKAADLGSGDGRIVIELARAGAHAVGYEINPLLALTSRKNIKKAEITKRASIQWKDFWTQDLSSFQVITLFGMPHMMKRLQEKLAKELRPGARVISHQFMFPDWPVSHQESQLYLYRVS